ncbi:MarR family winged helix-turn-helix transcriptional regulator [Flaviflagellibacter deserti]|uniref:MarR family winged helix-turn-helix transcriptional regulator n=1 Tax=Flaviflagellibacter deserti TaxID=2267266 RepID=A0ABV9YWY2_9HYPH
MPKSAPAHATLGLDDLICFAVYSTGHAFNRVYKPLLEKLGLTYPQYLVMVALWTEDDQTVGSLGDKLFLESSTLTPLLKRLEGMGHITRSRDPADERQVRVRLTKSGLSLQQDSDHLAGCILSATGLSLEDVLHLRATVAKLRGNLHKAALVE